MSHVLLIQSGVVVNCIEADSVERAQQFYPDCVCIERPDGDLAGPGWLYDGQTFTAPAAVVQAPQPLTRLEFLRRFTSAQRIAITAARATDPVINDAMQMLDLAVDVLTTDPDTIGLVEYLESKGYIGAADAAAILE